jgi:flagellar hook assembly protein FlgD
MIGKIKIVLISLFYCAIITAQVNYDDYSGFTVPTTPVLPTSEVHPSLWFNMQQVNSVKNIKNLGGYAAQIWSYVSGKIGHYKGLNVSKTNESDRPILAKTLAFAWLTNNDSVARDSAINALMIAYDNVPRDATSSNFDGTYDEIYRATWLQNYCAAYDWVKNNLSASQDSTIRNKIIEEVLLLRNNMTTGVKYAPRPHNHRSKPAYAIVTAALTFSSDPRASDWLQYALTQINTVTKYMFSSDGIYREGSHYNVYALVNAIPYLWQYKNVSGVDHFQYYNHVFEWALKVRNSKGWLPNIEDGYIKPFPTHMVAAAYNNTSTELHPTAPLSELLQWNWFNSNFVSHDYTGATNDATWDIDEYLTYDQSIEQVAPDFPTNYKNKCGVVVMRDNQSYSTTPTRQLYFNGVPDCDNHEHPDGLSYIVDYKGAILATDAGYGQNGSSDTLRNWYISDEAHNVVTINGIGPLDWSNDLGPTDLHFLNSSNYAFSDKLALGSPNRKIRRSIAFPNKKYWVVADIGYSSTSVSYQLLIHGRGNLSGSGNQETWTTPNDIYGTPQKLHSYILTSGVNSVANKSGFTSLYKDQVSQTYLDVSQTQDTALFLHVLYPDTVTSLFPQITNLSAQRFIGFVLSNSLSKDVFTFQKTNLAISVQSLVSDGLLTWVNYSNDKLNCFSINEGESFSWYDKQIISSDNYCTLYADLSQKDTNVIIFDTLSSLTTFYVNPSFIADSTGVILFNGIEVPFTLTNGMVSFKLIGQGTLQIIKCSVLGITEKQIVVPSKLTIINNYPNPFNPSTTINFNVFENAPVNLKVYNSIGKLIRTLLNEDLIPGNYNRVWDGKDDAGKTVSSGLYIFVLNSDQYTDRKKGMLLK